MPVKKLVFGQEWVEHPGAVVVKHPAAAKPLIDKGFDAPRFTRVPPGGGGGHNLIDAGMEPLGQRLTIMRALFNLGDHSRGKLGHLRSQLLDPVPRDHRGGFFAGALQQLGHAQLCAKIGTVDGERPVERRALAAVVPGKAVGMGKVQPQRHGARIGLCGAGKGSGGSGKVPRAHRRHAFSIGHLRNTCICRLSSGGIILERASHSASDRSARFCEQGGVVCAPRRP